MRKYNLEQSILRQRSATRLLLFVSLDMSLDPHFPSSTAAPAAAWPPCSSTSFFSFPTNSPVIIHRAKTQLHLNVDDILLCKCITVVHKMRVDQNKYLSVRVSQSTPPQRRRDEIVAPLPQNSWR